jgi:nucleoid DNA-binding protein
MPRKKKLGVDKISKDCIIDTVSKRTKISKAAVKEVFNDIFDVFLKELSAGNSITIHGFGSFDPKFMKSRISKNPKTQEPVDVPDKIVPHFAPGKVLATAFTEKQNELLLILGKKLSAKTKN